MKVPVEQMLSVKQQTTLLQIGAVATQLNMRAFLVGGTVRDVFLGVPPNDFDISIEGDALKLVAHIAEHWRRLVPDLEISRNPHVFKRYGTAKIALGPGHPLGQELDFSTLRSESYTEPGKAPEVAPGTLLQDLQRRDFSINAMAASLEASEAFTLYDLVEGYTALGAKRLTILHLKSFVDDPVRALRLLRMEERFAFTPDSATQRCYEECRDGKFLSAVPLTRRVDELRKVLFEREAIKIVARLKTEGFLEQIFQELRLGPTWQQLSLESAAPECFKRFAIDGREPVVADVLFVSLLEHFSPEQLENFLKQCGIGKQRITSLLRLHSIIGDITCT